MSRVGKTPVSIPNGVKVSVNGNVITVEGPKGKLSQDLHPAIAVTLENDLVTFDRPNDLAANRALHGTMKALVRNMVVGVTDGYTKTLELVGVGYRAEQKGQDINLVLGYSHPVYVTAPAGITLKVDGTTKIVVSGIDKQLLGQVCADIRKWRRPEPYKGKGILYAGEQVRRKAGKKSGK
jgi:large subunit ribosomal protein L6